MRRFAFLVFASMLVGCALRPPAPAPGTAAVPLAWSSRAAQLQAAQQWKLSGRAAVAIEAQGWQANLDWRQQGAAADVHLAGPLGVGAVELRLSPQGLEVLGAPRGEDPQRQLEQRLGFAAPFEDLRFWLLGVPNPALPFDLERNDSDRAARLTQDGWRIEYADYSAIDGDWLPHRMTLNHDRIRVRIAVDHWSLAR